MRKIILWFSGILLLLNLLQACSSKPEEAQFTIYCTSDVHGSIFNYDLKRGKETSQSLANASTILKEARTKDSLSTILLDGGDFLQGQPSIYYYNFIDTITPHIQAQVMNYLKYDAAAVGNHDIEAGHPVYDRIKKEFQFPWLSANLIDRKTGKPYFTPYIVLERQGIKIAVLGMTTPNIPQWLPEHLWQGIEFEDMIESSKKWIDIIQKQEKPDMIIGLFHSGYDYTYGGTNEKTPKNENASKLVAQQVDGFDIIIFGHDHTEKQEELTNDFGHKVLLMDPKSHGTYLGKIVVSLKRNGDHYQKSYRSELIDLNKVATDKDYISTFTPAIDKAKAYINTELGTFKSPLSGRDAMFGPSAFIDFINEAQLAESGAEISFASILSRDAYIKAGKITMKDMFNLYAYENSLYTMRLSGEEIRKYLEYAAAMQFNTMQSPKDHLLNFKKDAEGEILTGKKGYPLLQNDFFNFSAAAGIKYTVDVSKEPGNRITIISMADGTPFNPEHTYKVAVNSYQGNGGGGHLTRGAGIPKAELTKRIVDIREKDIRYYIAEYIKRQRVLDPQPRNEWKVIPEKWFKKGKEQDYKLLYSK